LSPEARFVVVHLLPLVEMKSFIPRLVGLVKHARVVRQNVIEQIQEAFSDMKLYFPKSGWEVGFAYVSEPVEGMETEFQDETQVQTFFSKKVFARIQQGVELLENIPMTTSTTVPWDNSLIYGLDAFGSTPGERYYLLRDPDRLAAISRMSRQLYEIALGSIYDNSCGVELAKEMGTLYGVEIGMSALKNLTHIVSIAKGADPTVLAPTRRAHVD